MTRRLHRRLARWTESAYELAIARLPLGLEPELRDAAVEMFRDRAREALRQAGVRALLVALVTATTDLAREAMAARAERVADRRQADTPRRTPMQSLFMDVRHAVRQWRRRPSFPLTALLALSLGIAVSAAMFSVVRGVMLQPLPFPAPDELVQVWDSNLQRNLPRSPTSPANLMDWRASVDAFADLAGYTTSTVTLITGGEAERVETTATQASLLELLGVPVALGRRFVAADEQAGNGAVVIVGHRLWTSRFNRDPDIIGRTLTINDQARQVVGVLESDVALAPETDLWIPLVFDFDIFQARSAKFVRVVGRLQSDATVAMAQEQINAVSATLAQTYPDTEAEWQAVVVPLHEQLVGPVATPLLVLSAGVGLLMLLACANVLNLQIAQMTSRRHEFVLRRALGAGRGRLVRQTLVETTLLAGASGLLGLGLAWGLTRLVTQLQPGNLPRVDNIAVDGAVVGFLAGLALTVGAGIGLASAGLAWRETRRATVAGGLARAARRHQVRRVVLVAQVAVAVMLVAGFGLVGRSLYGLLTTDPGFAPAGLVTATISPPRSRYPETEHRAEFYESVAERLRAIPQIERVTVTTQLPMTGLRSYGYIVDREPLPPMEEWTPGQLRAVDPDYFQTMQIPLRDGRLFTRLDDERAPAVVVINETMARDLALGPELLGTRLQISSGDVACPCEVIGVVADVRETGLETPPVPVYYLPQAQSIWTTRSVVVRSDAPVTDVVAAMRAAVASVDPLVPLYDIQPVGRIINQRLASPRFTAWLMGVFAVLALGLATAGIFGVTSYVVSQRMPELAVRAALGAGRSRLVWLVEREALATSAVGLTLGLAGTLAAASYVEHLLVNVSPFDVPVLAAAVGTLALVSAIAAFAPAVRAGRTDPGSVLKIG